MAVTKMQQTKAVQKAAIISFLVSIIVLGLKTFAYVQTGSTAVLSDALETIANVITAIVALIVLKFAMEPADDEHPYGHGKLEYFSAAFEGGIILFAALAILFESTRVLFVGGEPRNVIEGIYYVAIATVLNLFFGFYFKKIGNQHNSESLKATGTHLLADVKTTVGVMIGLLIYRQTGLAWIDPMIGILIGIWLGYESIQIIKRNLGGLLDETDMGSVSDLSKLINKHVNDQIIDIHNLRIIRSGNFHHIDAHLVVPEFLDVKTVHELIDDFEKKVVHEYKFDGEFAFHTDPCYRHYCSVCPQPHCDVRRRPMQERRLFDERNIVQGPKYTEL